MNKDLADRLEKQFGNRGVAEMVYMQLYGQYPQLNDKTRIQLVNQPEYGADLPLEYQYPVTASVYEPLGGFRNWLRRLRAALTNQPLQPGTGAVSGYSFRLITIYRNRENVRVTLRLQRFQVRLHRDVPINPYAALAAMGEPYQFVGLASAYEPVTDTLLLFYSVKGY